MSTVAESGFSGGFRMDDLPFSDKQKRFQKAVEKIVVLPERERHGIGMQKEKTLHAVLKNYKDPDEDHQEIPIGNYIADIYRDGYITEIQTAGFNRLRDKLRSFLPEFKVRIVYPIPASKWIIWIDPDTGEQLRRNKSPRKGSFYTAFRELYRIRPFLKDPNLSIELLLIDMDEYRLQDGWSRDRKRGSHRYDRIPLNIQDDLILEQPQDYLQFIPPEAEEPFTSKEFSQMTHYHRGDVSTILLILSEMGVLRRIGHRGRAYLYEIPEAMR